MKLILLPACLLLPFSGALSQQTGPRLDSLMWLAGCWEGTYSHGRIVSEQWMKPLGDMMMGMSRTVKQGKTIAYEHLRLQQTDGDTIEYVAHPSGQPEASFRLLTYEHLTATFENLRHDFPQRITYQLVSPDSLLARIEGTIDGKIRRSEFPYRRVRCP